MERVAVAAQPIDQRRFRACPEIAHRVRRPRRNRMWLRRLSRRPTETAVGAAERGLRDGRDQVAGRLVAHLALAEHQRAFAGALVDHLDNALATDHGALAGEGLMQSNALLAVDDLDP